MNPSRSANLEMVVRVAKALGPLCERVAFLGGATTALLLTDPAAPDVRPTLNVDVIVRVAGRQEYYVLEDELRRSGFRNRIGEGEPICRWHIENMIVDVMPTDPAILGFANRWYAEALQQAQTVQLAEDIQIRLVTAPYFLATKLEAFFGRGEGDFLGSHDLEDIITVVDGREELADEVLATSAPLCEFIQQEFSGLLADQRFLDALPGHLPPDIASQQRLPVVLSRLRRMSG